MRMNFRFNTNLPLLTSNIVRVIMLNITFSTFKLNSLSFATASVTFSQSG